MTVITITEFNAYYASHNGMEHQIPSMIHAINPSMSDRVTQYIFMKLVFQQKGPWPIFAISLITV